MLDRLITKIFFLCLHLLATLAIPGIAQSDYKLHIGLDVLPGDEVVSQRLKMISRYEVSSKFSAGLGTAFTYYNDPLSLLPLFVDLKYELMRTNSTPFIFLNTGYNISILTDTHTRIDHHRGGWMLNPGIGLQFNPEPGPGWHVSIGYNIDHSKFDTHEGTSRTIETVITYKRLMAGIGFAFSL